MDFQQYQEMCARKAQIFDDPDIEISYWLTGLLQAVNNLADITVRHKKVFGTRILCSEIGNALFCLSHITAFYGLDLQEIAEETI